MNMMATGLRIECVAETGDRLGETPLWCDVTERLWWIDIENPRLHSYDPATGERETVVLPGIYAGTQALTRAGDRLLAEGLTLYTRDADTGHRRDLVSPEHRLDNRLNDGRVDARGRFWVGTMDNGLSRPNGSLYRVDTDGVATCMESGVIVSNGIAFSPDGKTLYFTDTRRYTSYAYDLDLDDGVITNRRVFADYSATGDRPDGACVDVDGCLWAAFFAGGRIVRYRPDGRIDRTIALPITNPTCLAFGGRDLKTLYVTTARKFLSEEQLAAEPLAGALLAIEGAGEGLPEHHFGR